MALVTSGASVSSCPEKVSLGREVSGMKLPSDELRCDLSCLEGASLMEKAGKMTKKKSAKDFFKSCTVDLVLFAASL